MFFNLVILFSTIEIMILIFLFCIQGSVSVHGGILHYFLPRNEDTLFGYYLEHGNWVSIPLSNMPRKTEDTYQNCIETFHDIAFCTNYFFSQVLVLN